MVRHLMAVDLITDCEGFKPHAYKDSAGIITIGIGLARKYLDGSPIKPDDVCTLIQAQQWLNDYLTKFVYSQIDNLSKIYAFPDKVYAALCSFVYNEGIGKLSLPSFISNFKTKNWGTFDENSLTATGLAETFLKYDKITVDGVRVFSSGLQNRRIKEIKLMLS